MKVQAIHGTLLTKKDRAVIRRHSMRFIMEIEEQMNLHANKVYNERIKKRYDIPKEIPGLHDDTGIGPEWKLQRRERSDRLDTSGSRDDEDY